MSPDDRKLRSVYVYGFNQSVEEAKRLFPTAERVVRLEPSGTLALTFTTVTEAKEVAREEEGPLGGHGVRIFLGGVPSIFFMNF